jgi:adenylate cyclase
LNTSNHRQTRATILVIVASLVTAHLLFWLLARVFEPWNAQVIDQLFQWRSTSKRFQPRYEPTVVHLDLNNSSIQQLDDFYLNRSHFAQVLRNLTSLGVAAQMYDFVFAARSTESDDTALLKATAAAGNVYYGLAFALAEVPGLAPSAPKNSEVARCLEKGKLQLDLEGDANSMYAASDPLITFPALASVARGTGFISIKPDRDGVYRRAPLLVHYQDGFYASLPFRIACDYLGVTADRVRVRPGSEIVLVGARLPGSVPRDLHIPIDLHGNMLVNYVGSWERMKHYSFADVYALGEDREELDLWRDELAGKIVIVSDVSTRAQDSGPVPTDLNYPLSGLHANVINTILAGEFLRELNGLEMLPVEVLLVILLLALSLFCSSRTFLAGNLLLALGYLATVMLLFLSRGIIVGVVQPLSLLTLATVGVTAQRYLNEAKQKEVYRRTFESYFPPSVVRKIMANPEMIASSGQKKELSILFSDIKNFTHHTANLSPDQIKKALNEYFEAMVEIVFHHEGTVDKYIGDGLMVFFGDPESQPDHALRSVRAAIDMQQRARVLQQKWEKDRGIPLQIRIGINTGQVVVGNMGSARQFSYTVLGSAVNLAQRLETNAPVGGILISQRTHDLVHHEIPTEGLGTIQVKGLEQPVSVYRVCLDHEEGREGQGGAAMSPNGDGGGCA